MPTYVWPTRPDIEHALLHAGMTALTDHADPEMTWLPSGHLRWNRPGTRPLTKDQWACLSVSEDDHLSVLKDLEKDTPTGVSAISRAAEHWCNIGKSDGIGVRRLNPFCQIFPRPRPRGQHLE